MVAFVQTARELHRVSSLQEYQAKHRAAMAAASRSGSRHGIHLSPVVVKARVFANSWVADCECGNGMAIEPRWEPLALCFACGAVHRSVLIPAEWEAIDTALLVRLHPHRRHWIPGETVDDLIRENGQLDASGCLPGEAA